MNEIDSDFRRVQVDDPLSALTRQNRQLLLAVTLATLAVVHVGLVPSKISALGIEFTQANQAALLVLLAVMVAYYLVAFAFYAFADFASWRLAYGTSQRSGAKVLAAEVADAERRVDESLRQMKEHNAKLMAMAARLGHAVSLKMEDKDWASGEASWNTASMSHEDRESFQDTLFAYGAARSANRAAAAELDTAPTRGRELRTALFSSPIALVRAGFDFLLPVLAGVYALVAVAVSIWVLR